jgi:hypothetical protein
VSGKSMLFLRNTTRCIAVLNSSRDRAPSLVTSASCLQQDIYLLPKLVCNYHHGQYIITADSILNTHNRLQCQMSVAMLMWPSISETIIHGIFWVRTKNSQWRIW